MFGGEASLGMIKGFSPTFWVCRGHQKGKKITVEAPGATERGSFGREGDLEAASEEGGERVLMSSGRRKIVLCVRSGGQEERFKKGEKKNSPATDAAHQLLD